MVTNDDNTDYRVSVVMPAYNAGKYIGRAIDSILAQSRKPYEIIVVNDGSTDETEEIVLGYGSQIRYIKQENGGCSAARNTGVKACKGNWICFLDSDDEWLPKNLEMQVGLLERNPDLVWTSANFIKCLCGENRRGPHIDPEKGRRMLRGQECFDNFFAAFVEHCTGWVGSTLMRRDVFIEAGMSPVGIDMSEDLDLWFRIAYRWQRIGFCPEPVAIYHMNVAENMTSTYKESSNRSDFIERHLRLSAEQGCEKDFEIVVRHLVKSWCRDAVFRGSVGEVKEFITRFGRFTSIYFRFTVKTLMLWPGLTRYGCRWISHFVRFFKLRRQVVRRVIEKGNN